MDDYLKVSFKELFAEDGLAIMGRGLGIQNLYSKFAQYYSSKDCGRKLVFCLNCTGAEEQLHDLFVSNASPGVRNLPQVINNEVSAQDRIEKYMQGGCYIITSRILIVDLLDNKVDATSISGLLVYNAHRISETSVESFIIKVFRERNRLGFVKGFSEDPEALQSGFGKVERLMRSLYVKRLYLWPRFRLEIVEALRKSREPEVVELITGLTPHMKSIQSAVLAAMNTCIQELKKAAPHLETAQMTLENGLFQAFDLSIKNQLDAEWHRTPARTKQLVADMGVLRKLLDYLIRYDAFSFYYLLMKLQQASTDQATPSMWLMSEAANQIFKKAKERVYQVQPLPAAGASSSSSKAAPKDARTEFVQRVARQYGLTSVMRSCGECPPKWKLATSVLAEIKKDYTAKRTAADPALSAAEQASAWFHHQSTAGRVLFIVKDSMAQAQLRDVLVAGLARVCDERYRWFVSQQAVEIRGRLRKQNLQQQQQSQRRGAGAGTKRPHTAALGLPGSGAEPAAKSARTEDGSRNAFLYPSDSDLLSSAASEAEVTESSAALEFGIPDSWFATLPVESKLILIEERALRLPSTTVEQSASKQSAPAAAESASASSVSMPQRATAPTAATSQASLSGSSEDTLCTAAVLDPDLHVHIMTHSEVKENFTTLHDCCPAYVVLYDPDITIIRTIETYQSAQPADSPPVKVYFLLYEGSGEEHRYAGALVKEKKAFESLIAAKEHMVISLPDHPADVLQEVQSDKLLLSLDTRTLQKNQSKGPRSIVVDVRDFRCTLPSVLYGSGKFTVIPRTLQVGDYVLSPEICVERKGISDLFQSFTSGRLYNQAESMFRHYKHPCLLIEFAQDKAFCLLAANEMSPDILQQSITSRISLLALSFPNLRILWSRSAACTVEIFRSLVTNHEQVDVDKAVAAGSLTDGTGGTASGLSGLPGAAAGAAEEDVAGDGDGEGELAPAGYYDDVQWPVRKIAAASAASAKPAIAAAVVADESARASAREMLLSLPGINVHNFRDVMNAVTNLAELSAMSVEQLEPLIGPVNAKKLYTFFGQNC